MSSSTTPVSYPPYLKRRQKPPPSPEKLLGLPALTAIPSVASMKVLKLADEGEINTRVLNELRRQKFEEGDEVSPNIGESVQFSEVDPPRSKTKLRPPCLPSRKFEGRPRKPKGPRPGWRWDRPRTFWCWVCNEVHYDKRSLRSHLLEKHDMQVDFGKWQRDGTVRCYECTECGQPFTAPFKLKIHFDQAHTPNECLQFQCEQCLYRFATMKNMTSHFDRVHGPNRSTNYICSDCNSGYQTKKEYTKHLRRIHKLTPEQDAHISWCLYCSSSFFIPQNYMEHVLDDHSELEPKFFCRRCEKVYGTTVTFLDHGCPPPETVVPQTGKKFYPETPGTQKEKIVTDKIKLRPNNPLHEDQPFHPFKCPDCHQLFQDQRSYVGHIVGTHGRPDPIQQLAEAQSEAQRLLIAASEIDNAPERMDRDDEDQNRGKDQGDQLNKVSPSVTAASGGGGEREEEGTEAQDESRKESSPASSQRITAVPGKVLVAELGSQFECPDCGVAFPYLNDLNGHRTEEDHWGLPDDLMGSSPAPKEGRQGSNKRGRESGISGSSSGKEGRTGKRSRKRCAPVPIVSHPNLGSPTLRRSVRKRR